MFLEEVCGIVPELGQLGLVGQQVHVPVQRFKFT